MSSILSQVRRQVISHVTVTGLFNINARAMFASSLQSKTVYIPELRDKSKHEEEIKKNGVSIFQTLANFYDEKKGSMGKIDAPFGNPGGTFVTLPAAADEIEKTAMRKDGTLDPTIVAKKLGLNISADAHIIRADFKTANNVRKPTSSASSANSNFIEGEMTSGGMPEALTDSFTILKPLGIASDGMPEVYVSANIKFYGKFDPFSSETLASRYIRRFFG